MSAGYPIKKKGLRAKLVDDRAGLFDRRGAQVCVLNETALALWELCDGATAPEEMVDAVRVACGLDREVAAADIERTLTELTAAGLVSWSADAG
jgi:hypothetical protein